MYLGQHTATATIVPGLHRHLWEADADLALWVSLRVRAVCLLHPILPPTNPKTHGIQLAAPSPLGRLSSLGSLEILAELPQVPSGASQGISSPQSYVPAPHSPGGWGSGGPEQGQPPAESGCRAGKAGIRLPSEKVWVPTADVCHQEASGKEGSAGQGGGGGDQGGRWLPAPCRHLDSMEAKSQQESACTAETPCCWASWYPTSPAKKKCTVRAERRLNELPPGGRLCEWAAPCVDGPRSPAAVTVPTRCLV